MNFKGHVPRWRWFRFPFSWFAFGVGFAPPPVWRWFRVSLKLMFFTEQSNLFLSKKKPALAGNRLALNATSGKWKIYPPFLS